MPTPTPVQVFATTCTVKYMGQINRRALHNYHDHLRALSNAPRTVANRSNFLKIFFFHQKIAWPLAKTDRVQVSNRHRPNDEV